MESGIMGFHDMLHVFIHQIFTDNCEQKHYTHLQYTVFGPQNDFNSVGNQTAIQAVGERGHMR